MTTQEILAQAKATATAGVLATLPAERKNEALEAMAAAVEAAEEAILAANAEDMEAARDHIADVMLDRLLLTPARIAGMAADRKSTRLNSSHTDSSRMPSSA